MVSKNTWIKGINSDLSKLKTSNETYLDALNMTVITQDGNSSYALQNPKGNKRTFVLPETGPTFKLDNFDPAEVNFEIEILFTDLTSLTITVLNYPNKSLEQINIEINNQLVGYPQVKCYYNSNYLVIYDLFNTISTIAGLNVEITTWTYVCDSYILGWGYADNTLILVTGDSSSLTPNPDEQQIIFNRPGTVGCIWKIPIDNETGRVITSTGLLPYGDTLPLNEFCVYKEFLNLSRYYNIYKSLKCRRENINVLRVVFTDFYNDIKTINVLQDQIQATPVELLNILPIHASKQATITNVLEGGFCPTGRYQFWYQLASTQGALSTISELSTMITLGGQENLQEYSGNVVGTNSAKSIRIRITGIDTNYDLIKLGYTVYQVTGLAESFFFDEIAIPNNGEIITVLNGNENLISIEDQTLLSNVNKPPTICKTLDVVRNKLIIGNTKTKNFDLDFDPRVYRFSGIGVDNDTNAPDQTAYLYETGDAYGSPTTIIDGTSPVYPTAQLDLINPFNNENPDIFVNPLANGSWDAFAQFKYQTDGITLGGNGPNLSYKFVTKNTLEDSNATTAKKSFNTITPVYDTSEGYNLGNRVQPIPGSFANMRSPYYDSTFWGYARGEVYRWAIVFKDLYGFNSFAYWIGDIKFPTSKEIVISDRPGTTINCYQLGIEFTLDTTTPAFQAIKDKISGWSFVRMDRLVTDKTKLGTGMMDNTSDPFNDAIRGFSVALPYNLTGNSLFSTFPPSNNNIKVLHIPSFHKNLDNEFKPGDYFKIIGWYGQVSSIDMLTPSNSYYRNFEFLNLFDATRRPIDFKWSVESSKSENYIPADPSKNLGVNFINLSTNITTNAIAGEYTGAGNKLDLITLPANLAPFTNETRWCISYERYLDDQYGGNILSARYNNTYIFTGHYQPYKLNQSVNPTKVFGGDVVTLQYVYQVLEKNIAEDSGWSLVPSVDSLRTALFFPTEAHGFNPFYLVYEPPYSEAGRSSNRQGSDKNILEERIPVNLAYGQVNNTAVAVSKPLIFNNIKEEPYTLYSSPNKIDGEIIDSWRNFKTNNFLSVNGNYGPINRIIEFKDKLYYYQNSGVGIAAIDERVMISEGASEQTQLGTGGVLARYDYISTETGVIHQFAVEKSGSGIYHYDALLNKAFRYSQNGQEPLSDIKGLIGVFNVFDKSIKSKDQLFLTQGIGVHIAFDSWRNQIFYTLLGSTNQQTYSYNELIGAFDSRHSFTPNMYLNMRSYFLSTSQGNNNIYLHNIGDYNLYYDNQFESTVTFRNNLDQPDLVKTFDNMWINNEVILDGVNVQETVDYIQFKNDYQISPQYQAALNIKPLLRTWRWNKIRDTSNLRMRDKYIDTTLIFNPNENQNKQFILHDVIFENSMRGVINPK